MIREIKVDDLQTLVTTFLFPWATKQQTIEKWSQRLEEHEKRIRTVYLLVVEGKIIGYASLLRQSDYPAFRTASIPEINDVWISENFRHKGYGKMLMLHIEDIARTEGYLQIGLGVGLYADYGQAQKLYSKLGYIPDGKGITHKNVPTTPGREYTVDDDLLLWLTKSLNDPNDANSNVNHF